MVSPMLRWNSFSEVEGRGVKGVTFYPFRNSKNFKIKNVYGVHLLSCLSPHLYDTYTISASTPRSFFSSYYREESGREEGGERREVG